jgi:hypothetical protein
VKVVAAGSADTDVNSISTSSSFRCRDPSSPLSPRQLQVVIEGLQRAFADLFSAPFCAALPFEQWFGPM